MDRNKLIEFIDSVIKTHSHKIIRLMFENMKELIISRYFDKEPCMICKDKEYDNEIFWKKYCNECGRKL